MTTRALAMLNVAFLTLTAALSLAPSDGFAQAADNPAATAGTTQDVLHMADGRVLRGQIVSETKSLVIFEYLDPSVKLTAKITLLKDDIAKIERDLAVAAEAKPAETQTAKAPEPSRSSKKDPTPAERTYGALRADSSLATAPSFYIVPLKGQMGTDVNPEVYKKIIDEIKSLKPDIIVYTMNCQDTEDVLYSEKNPLLEGGLLEWDEYRTLVRNFHNDLRGFRQVCWVEDSVGVSSMVALSWNEVYMKPTARFGGLGVAHTGHFTIPDLDVRGKMVAALMGFVKSFLETGGHSLVLADAMVQPDQVLSASWKGRDVIWSLNQDGEYVVDANEKRTTEFRAKTAEDFAISKGTADTLDDLALLLGYREYRVLDSQAEKICEEYVKGWRGEYEAAKVLLEDIKQFMGWGELAKAQAAWKKILRSMERYKAVEIRLGREFGLTKNDIIVIIEQLAEQIRAGRNGRGAGGGIGSGGGTGAAK